MVWNQMQSTWKIQWKLSISSSMHSGLKECHDQHHGPRFLQGLWYGLPQTDLIDIGEFSASRTVPVTLKASAPHVFLPSLSWR